MISTRNIVRAADRTNSAVRVRLKWGTVKSYRPIRTPSKLLARGPASSPGPSTLASFLPQRTRHFRQPGQDRGILQPQFVIYGGSAADQGSCRNIIRHSTLRRDNGGFTNFAVADHTDLSGKNRPRADFR